MDLRKRPDIEGVRPDALKAYKQRARQLLRSEGVPFEKAPYATEKPGATPVAKARSAPKAEKRPAAPPNQAPAHRGFFSRLFRRA